MSETAVAFAADPEEDRTGFDTAAGQTFEAGRQSFANSANPVLKDPTVVNPNATRWLINPLAYIDVSARPVSGYLCFDSGGLYPIEPQNNRVSLSGISSTPGKLTNSETGQQFDGGARPDVPGATYRNEVRTAHAIATEMESAYADKGLRILGSLTGVLSTDPVVDQLWDQLVRPGIQMNMDPAFPEHPVMNLPRLDAHLRTVAMRDASTLPGAGTGKPLDPIAFVGDILTSLQIAIQTARQTTNDAKRHVANKTVGYQHTFDAWATRCFIALGKSTPSDLPPQYQSGVTPQASAELDRLRLENERLRAEKARLDIEAETARLMAENANLSAETAATLTPPTVPAPEAPSVAVTCSGQTRAGAACKSTNIDPATGRCPSHPLESDTKEESTNGNDQG